MARSRLIRRWRRNMEVGDDVPYVEMLQNAPKARCDGTSTPTSTSNGIHRNSR